MIFRGYGRVQYSRLQLLVPLKPLNIDSYRGQSINKLESHEEIAFAITRLLTIELFPQFLKLRLLDGPTFLVLSTIYF